MKRNCARAKIRVHKHVNSSEAFIWHHNDVDNVDAKMLVISRYNVYHVHKHANIANQHLTQREAETDEKVIAPLFECH